MTYSKEFLDLYNNLFAVIPYPQDVATQVAASHPLWKDFCALPQEVKDIFHFGGDDWNYGYIKKGSKENEDQKEYYHYSFHHRELLEKHGLLEELEKYPVAKKFFEYCDELFGQVTNFAYEYTTVLAKNNTHIADLPEQTKKGFEGPFGVIRFLHYTPPKDAEILADPHFDRGGMTFHLYESQEGLQFMDWDGTWRDAPILKDETVLFSGIGLEALSDKVLQRTWHRVIADEHATNPERYSIVLFCDFPDVQVRDRKRDGIARLEPQKYVPKKDL